MSSTENQKIDELLGKLRGLADRAKSTRAQFGQPVADRLLDRLNKLSSRLPQANGDSHSQQQPQTPLKVCPKCGHSFDELVDFCSSCGFSFLEEKRRQQREEIEREKLERSARMGINV